MKTSNLIVLGISLLGGIGGWAVTLANWGSAVTPVSVGGLFLILSSTLGAAFGVNTKKE